MIAWDGSPQDIEVWRRVGRERQKAAIAKGRRDQHGFAGDPILIHAIGASAEFVVARVTGKKWHAFADKIKREDGSSIPDVGEDIQVRSTSHPAGRLLVHRTDRDDETFVLARTFWPRVEVIGWLWGYEAKEERYWQQPNPRQSPAFFAPNSVLRSIYSLLDADAPERFRQEALLAQSKSG